MDRMKLRALTAAGSILGTGLVVVAAIWIESRSAPLAVALVAFYVLAAFAVVLLATHGKGDISAIASGRGDERQRLIDLRATAVAGLAMGSFCLVMAIVSLASGDEDNPWLIVCLVGAVAYVVAVTIERYRT